MQSPEADRSSHYDAMNVPAMPPSAAPMQMPPPSVMAPEPIATPAMMWTFDTTSLDTDFWNPNILSTANWLDAVVDPGFDDVPWDLGFANGQAAPFDPYGNPMQQQQSYTTPTSWDANQNLEGSKQAPERSSPAGLVSLASGQSGASTESAAEACAASEDTPTRAGYYYVDGQPARLPRTKRRKLSAPPPTRIDRTTSSRNFSLQVPPSADVDLSHRIAMPLETYEMIQAAYRTTCSNATGIWSPFDEVILPSQELFEHLLSLYFASFYKTLPFLHPATFNAAETHWLLLLALASVGAHYFAEENDLFVVSLHELLRRSLALSRENMAWHPPRGIVLAQIEMLLLVGLLYSGDDRHKERGMEMQGLFSLCHDTARNDYHQAAKSRPVSDSSLPVVEERWRSWVRLESAKRTAYSAWLLSAMIRYQLQLRRSLSLADATLPLPCHELLWTVGTAEEWEKMMSSYVAPPPLQESLQQLYVDKRLPKERGEFARILLVHGLYQRSWEVERYFGNPLSSWNPVAKKQDSSELLPTAPIWLPSIMTYNKWQNSTCDSLDILHWQANSTIGQASGMEHPTVGHLHLARVILLSPINHIVKLAKVMTNGDDATQQKDIEKHRHICRRWAVQGVYKARLAAIHAGVTMWHIRRYSVDGFYEAPAVALATLLLWAFSTFSVKQRPNGRPSNNGQGQTPQQPRPDGNASGEESSDEASCGIILLDRPTDDELVQQFVRKGHKMCAHITHVGDLYGPKGPELMLAEGYKLLDSLKCWGVASNWATLLQRLMQVCQQEKVQR